MAFPIIKIKRGIGVPAVWSGIAGLTAGEFAYDIKNKILYVGATGGYTAYDPTQGACGLGQLRKDQSLPVAMPIGMQISNDGEFGAGAEVNIRGGYSDYTVPTTKAVRDWVTLVKNVAVSGYTLYAGEGISLGYFNPASIEQGLTIYNTGVIKGFTSIGLSGNNGNGNKGIYASSSVDGFTLEASDGIQIIGSNQDRTLSFRNTGVLSIGGATGGITLINPIKNLKGFSGAVQDINLIGIVAGSGPLVVDQSVNTFTDLDDRRAVRIGHGTSPQYIADGYEVVDSLNRFQFWGFSFDQYGHLIKATPQILTVGVVQLPGLTEAAQDALAQAFEQNSSNYFAGSGSTAFNIEILYNDSAGFGMPPAPPGINNPNPANSNTFRFINRGVTSIGIAGSAGFPSGLSGPVKLAASTDISILHDGSNPQNINIGYIGKQFRDITIKNAGFNNTYTSTPATGDIYWGGSTGIPGHIAATQVLSAQSNTDNLTMFAGRGIGLCGGLLGSGNDTLLIWNTGINLLTPFGSGETDLGGLSGPVNIKSGSGIVITRPNPQDILISSNIVAGSGTIVHAQADYAYENYSTAYSAEGVTGLVNITGITAYGFASSQTTGSGTKDGTIYIGPTSKIYLPTAKFFPNKYPATDLYGQSFPRSEIVLPTLARTRSDSGLGTYVPYPYPLGPFDRTSYSIGQEYPYAEYNRVVADVIESGMTLMWDLGGGYGPATVGGSPTLTPWHGSGTWKAKFGSNYADINKATSEPGNVLILQARPGKYTPAPGGGGGPILLDPYNGNTASNTQIRLHAFPTYETLSSYLQVLIDGQREAGVGTGQVYGCVNANCVDNMAEPGLPGCALLGSGNEFSLLTLQDIGENEERISKDGSIIMKGNILAHDNVYVHKDIWLRGNIFDASTGCLYATPGGSSPGGSPGGVSGDLVVTGSIYVHGKTAFFNVDNLSTESPLVYIGGQSGPNAVGHSNPSTTVDKGLILFHRGIAYHNPIQQTAYDSSISDKIGFFGIDASDGGTLKYFRNITNITNNVIDGGVLGHASFAAINNVGITSDNANTPIISLRSSPTNSTSTTTPVTNARFSGQFDISGPNVGTTPTIVLGQNAALRVEPNTSAVNRTVGFKTGVTFGAGTNTITYSGSPYPFIIGYNDNDGSDGFGRLISFRDPGYTGFSFSPGGITGGNGIVVVDTGRAARRPSIANNNASYHTGTVNVDYLELPQQILYNKTLSEGTVIDCGTY